MKKRIKNLVTTSIGVVIIIMSFVMWFMGKLDTVAFGSSLALGCTYLAAKDTLINGVTLGLTKFGSNEKPE